MIASRSIFLRSLHSTPALHAGGFCFCMTCIIFLERRSTVVATAVDFRQGEKHRQDWLLVLAGHDASYFQCHCRVCFAGLKAAFSNSHQGEG